MIASPISYPALSNRSVKLSARAVLPPKTDHLWRIETGAVRALTWLEDGTTVVLGLWAAGELVGKPPAQIGVYHLECMTQVEAVPVPIASLTQYPLVVLEHVNQLEHLLQIRSYRRVDVMILQFLSWLSSRFGKDTHEGRMIDLRLTHLDIAEFVGATRVTVTRILNQFEQQGVICYQPFKRIVLRETELWHYEI